MHRRQGGSASDAAAGDLMPDSDYERAVADCVVRSMSEVSSLVTMRESPDADLLLVNGSHVGLEIVGLIDPGPLAAKRLMESAREAIERELEARGICEYVEVIFELAEILAEINMGVGRDWLRNLPRLMAALLAECRDARIEKSTLEAYGVTGVAYVERKPHTRSVVGRGYRQWTNPEQTLAHATLKNKHEKLDQYRI